MSLSALKVTFTDTFGLHDIFSPAPASLFLADWYKSTDEYTGGVRVISGGTSPHTIKKCIPVFDALTAGYIIPTYAEIQVTQVDGSPYYQWPQFDAISFHPISQAPNHPDCNGAPYPKWNNPWSIRTPPGYSCLFLHPMHNPNGIFTVLPGVVDTDTYTPPVNFPFVLNDPAWEGLIPPGTPMVQVIPFKRDSWRINFGGDQERDDQARAISMLRSLWFNSYKRQFWTRKEYR